jgi:hypothetical protein
MRGGLLKSWSGVCLALAIGACSNIIGISSYEIDPSLDEAQAGASSGGGESGTGGGGQAGENSAGASGNGAATEGGSGNPEPGAGGSDAVGGDSSGGGEPPVIPGCRGAQDCDDEIDCTVDVCAADGSCNHQADDTTCDPSRCETCRLGIGCVASDMTTMPLLTDGNFDQASSGWTQDSDRENIVTSAMAQSGTRLAQFGPGPGTPDATEQEYDDLYQLVSIPEAAVAVTLTGYYKLTPGQKAPTENKLWAALYQGRDTAYTALFFKLDGDLPAKNAWGTPFSYTLSTADLHEIAGLDFSFDIVATLWDSAYQLDSLQLTASVCE